MTADLDTGLAPDIDIHTDGYADAAYEWSIACDGRGAIVEFGVSILPDQAPSWPMPRTTPRALRDLADRLLKIADNPSWWMPVDEAP